jgi:2-keto-3-deoxy-6-phosphogluconate aldolase
MSKYLESPLVLCVGGSWLVSADLVRNKDWNAIQQRAVTSTALARGVTGASKIRN